MDFNIEQSSKPYDSKNNQATLSWLLYANPFLEVWCILCRHGRRSSIQSQIKSLNAQTAKFGGRWHKHLSSRSQCHKSIWFVACAHRLNGKHHSSPYSSTYFLLSWSRRVLANLWWYGSPMSNISLSASGRPVTEVNNLFTIPSSYYRN